MNIDIGKLRETPNLLDILIQMEDVLDQMDIYVFENWLKGVVAEGPIVKRYWLNFTLLYPLENMPDPRGAMRLLKHGIRVNYKKARRTDEPEQETKEEDLVWLVEVSIPRRLVVQIDAAQHDFYDDEVDVDDVEDAKDSGMDSETAYTADGEQQPWKS